VRVGHAIFRIYFTDFFFAQLRYSGERFVVLFAWSVRPGPREVPFWGERVSERHFVRECHELILSPENSLNFCHHEPP
jgi:hypothetical protein